MTESWSWSEPHFEPNGKKACWGSGYPSDPKCKDWMGKNLSDPVFGYPDFVRFSWGTTKNAFNGECVEVEWEADEDKEEDDERQTNMSSFIVSKSGDAKRKRPRLGYFEKMCINPVTKIVSL